MPTATASRPARASARVRRTLRLRGLAKGEASAVQARDVDFLQPPLRVSRQLQRDGATCTVRLSKCGPERDVYLPDELVDILADYLVTHLLDADPDAWLFTVEEEPMYDNDITRRWRATQMPPSCRTSASTTSDTSTPPG